jgi:hypothetical protein
MPILYILTELIRLLLHDRKISKIRDDIQWMPQMPAGDFLINDL